MWLLQTLKLSARHSVTGRGCGVLLRFAKTSATSKPLRIPTLAPSWWGGGTCWDPILLARQAVAALGHAIFLASVPQPRWTETAGENPPCPRHHLHRPRLHPTACPGGVRAGQARTRGRRHSAPPPQPLPAPNTDSLFRKAWRGGRKVRTCQRWQAGVSPAGSPSQPARASRTDRGQQGVGSGPWPAGMEDAEGGQHGSPEWKSEQRCRQARRSRGGPRLTKVFSFWFFWRRKLSSALRAGRRLPPRPPAPSDHLPVCLRPRPTPVQAALGAPQRGVCSARQKPRPRRTLLSWH